MEDLLDNPEVSPKITKRRTFLLVSTVAVIGVYAAGVLLALDDIFSILVSGPAIGGIGLFFVVLSFIFKERIGMIFGASVALSVLGIFLLIYSQEIRPHDAQFVVPVIGGLCWIVVVGIGTWFIIHLRKFK